MLRPTLLLLSCLLGHTLIAQDAKLVYNKTVNSTVTIETDKGMGSGFFVGQNIIATNFHVLEGTTTAYCYTNNSNTRYNIEGFVAVDTSADLILLKVIGLNRTPLKLAQKPVVTGQKIFVLGSPKGLPATISDGLVSGLRDFNGHKFIQITAPISRGSSGGPVLNAVGELIGVSVGQINDGQNLNFAIPKTYLQTLLNSKKSKAELLTALPIKSSSSNQSKTETEDWIKEKIESFSRSYNKIEKVENYSFNFYGNYKYEVDFKDCNITIKSVTYDNSPGFNNDRSELYMTFIHKIPINKLAKLSFIKIQEDYQIIFKIKTNENLIETTTIVKSKYTNETKSEKESNVSLYIPQNLLNNNLPERLTNAFNNLIELCGGKVTKEIF